MSAAIIIYCDGRRRLAYGNALHGWKCSGCGKRLFWLVAA